MSLESQLRLSLIHAELLKLAEDAEPTAARILRYAARVLRMVA